MPIANRPVVLHALDLLDEAGIERVVVVADPEVASEVQDAIGDAHAWRPRVTCIEQDVGGSLGSVAELVTDLSADEPFLLHLGDSLARESLAGLLESDTRPTDTTMLMQAGSGENERVVDLANGRNGGRGSTPAGVYVVGKELLEASREVGARANCELQIIAAADRLHDLGGHLETREVHQWWRYGRRSDGLLDANRFMLEGLESETAGAELVDTRIQGGVVIHPSAQLRSTIVRGPAIIGQGVRLTDAYIGPYTSIGNDVVIEGAEVEHSIILPGASLRHIGGRLEASVVGREARVFRDFRLPKALRLNVGEGAEVSLI